jgi:hypothetical protein
MSPIRKPIPIETEKATIAAPFLLWYETLMGKQELFRDAKPGRLYAMLS